MYDQETPERTAPAGGGRATETVERPAPSEPTARDKVADVAETAKHEAGTVVDEVGRQAGRVASDMRDQLGHQARTRQQQLADRVRQAGEDLHAMAADREESPARTAVEQLANRSEQMAEYLSKRGPEGVLADVQDFARRRPAAFLLSAALAGFVVGRVTKGVFAQHSSTGEGSTYRSAATTDTTATAAVGVVPAAAAETGAAYPSEAGTAYGTQPGTAYATGVAAVPETPPGGGTR